MAFRYTMEELGDEKSPKYLTDLKLIRSLIVERQQSTTNVYSPLNKRLNQLYKKVNSLIQRGRKNI